VKHIPPATEQSMLRRHPSFVTYFLDHLNADTESIIYSSLAGYMPLNGQFGYITGYTAARQAEYYRTIAHEVAHGTFNLRHTFSKENRYMLSEGTTNNLLDYNGGIALYKYQWDLIHDPEKIWFAWMQEEEEAEDITNDEEIEWILEIYSPMISEKFLEAKEKNDYYEMRRLTYWALQNKFDNNWNEKVTLGFHLPENNPVAKLKHNVNAKYGGIRVYYTIKKYLDDKFVGIMAKTKPIYFPPNTKLNGKYFDAYFPVDVKLYEGEGKMPTGDTYYGDNDFLGI